MEIPSNCILEVLAELLVKTEQAALKGRYELFKTAAHIDSTARHPDWRGSESDPVRTLAPQLPG